MSTLWSHWKAGAIEPHQNADIHQLKRINYDRVLGIPDSIFEDWLERTEQETIRFSEFAFMAVHARRFLTYSRGKKSMDLKQFLGLMHDRTITP